MLELFRRAEDVFPILDPVGMLLVVTASWRPSGLIASAETLRGARNSPWRNGFGTRPGSGGAMMHSRSGAVPASPSLATNNSPMATTHPGIGGVLRHVQKVVLRLPHRSRRGKGLQNTRLGVGVALGCFIHETRPLSRAAVCILPPPLDHSTPGRQSSAMNPHPILGYRFA